MIDLFYFIINLCLSPNDRDVWYNTIMKKKKRQTLTRPMLERIVVIHEKIKDGLYPSTSKLADCLEVATATISRDVQFLRDRFYAPIAYDSAHRGYYYSENFELPLNVLSNSDMEVLTSAKVLFSHFEGTPIHDQLCSIIDYLAPNDKNDSAMINRIATPPVSKAFYDKSIWKDIYNAMKTNQVIEFDYNGLWRAEQTHRRVHPYQLVMDDGQVYLLGFSEERNAERIFSLTRMSNMVITEDKFELPDNYDFSKRCGGGKFGFYFQEDKTKFKLRFMGIAQQVVKERLWADDQVIEDKGDYVELTFTSNQQKKILDWVLSQGYTVKPLEPEWFVEFWKDSILKMSKLAGIN